MIKVTLELLPSGVDDSESKKLLGEIIIANDLIGTISSGGRRGNYSYKLFKKTKKKIAGSGKIRDYPRLSYHPWELVRLILNDAKSDGVL